jgi:hypothetical protein
MTPSNTDDPLGFAKFVPGFDFLQGLSKGAAQSSNAASPASAAFNQWFTPSLSAEDLDKRIGELKTVQFWLEQNTRALAATIQALEVQKMTLATLKSMNFPMPSAFTQPASSPGPNPSPQAREASPAAEASTDAKAAPSGPAVDPIQLWGALTQQFQNIASTALKDVGQAASHMASQGVAPAAPTSARKPAAKKPAARPAAKKTSAARTPKRS